MLCLSRAVLGSDQLRRVHLLLPCSVKGSGSAGLCRHVFGLEKRDMKPCHPSLDLKRVENVC